MNTPFDLGKLAFASGKTEADNPFIIGKTALGNDRLSEGGADWLIGFNSAKPPRVPTAAELVASRSVDVSRFRRKSNRCYR